MTTLIHLWPGPDGDHDHAILDTPMHPARFYFGPAKTHDHGETWTPLDNATYRYHVALTDALTEATRQGFDVEPIVRASVAQTICQRTLADAERVADFIFTTKATDYCDAYIAAARILGEGFKDGWTHTDAIEAILRATRAAERELDAASEPDAETSEWEEGRRP